MGKVLICCLQEGFIYPTATICCLPHLVWGKKKKRNIREVRKEVGRALPSAMLHPVLSKSAGCKVHHFWEEDQAQKEYFLQYAFIETCTETSLEDDL